MIGKYVNVTVDRPLGTHHPKHTNIVYNVNYEALKNEFLSQPIPEDKTSIEKVTALIEVRVTPQRGQGFDNIAERIYNYPEVNSVYLISGGYDLLLTIEGKTLKEDSSFVSYKLSALEYVLSTATHFILKKYKDHGTILAEEHEDYREVIMPWEIHYRIQ